MSVEIKFPVCPECGGRGTEYDGPCPDCVEGVVITDELVEAFRQATRRPTCNFEPEEIHAGLAAAIRHMKGTQ